MLKKEHKMSEYILTMLEEAANTSHNHKRGAKTIEPRMLIKREAAEYCRICPSNFQTWIDQRLVPGALPRNGRPEPEMKRD